MCMFMLMLIQQCTYIILFQVDVPSCSDSLDLPNPNAAGESYGPGSRCIEHGQIWNKTVVNNGTVDTNSVGVGCYQVSC